MRALPSSLSSNTPSDAFAVQQDAEAGNLGLFRKSYSMHSPPRNSGNGCCHVGCCPVARLAGMHESILYTNVVRCLGARACWPVLLTSAEVNLANPSAFGGGNSLPIVNRGGGGGRAGQDAAAIIYGTSPAASSPGLTRQYSLGGVSRYGGVPRNSTHNAGASPMQLRRSRTFSDLVGSSDQDGMIKRFPGKCGLWEGSTSTMLCASRLSPSVPRPHTHSCVRAHPRPLAWLADAPAASEGEFKLFGDVDVPLTLTGDSNQAMTSQQSFRLFGGVQPLALRLEEGQAGLAAAATAAADMLQSCQYTYYCSP